MPKLKTRKSIAKRFKITKSGKIIKKRAGQDHFNARESGNVMRKKRRTTQISKSKNKTIKANLPYSK